jgi:hypothetical protein
MKLQLFGSKGLTMKTNTKDIKNSLQNILIRMPQDFALEEIRLYIKKAITAIENIEKKREKREISYKERKEQSKKTNDFYLYDPTKTIRAIDEEILKEKAKLENIKNQSKKNKDDENFETVLG